VFFVTKDTAQPRIQKFCAKVGNTCYTYAGQAYIFLIFCCGYFKVKNTFLFFQVKDDITFVLVTNIISLDIRNLLFSKSDMMTLDLKGLHIVTWLFVCRTSPQKGNDFGQIKIEDSLVMNCRDDGDGAR
jgi:hypothetical protein